MEEFNKGGKFSARKFDGGILFYFICCNLMFGFEEKISLAELSRKLLQSIKH